MWPFSLPLTSTIFQSVPRTQRLEAFRMSPMAMAFFNNWQFRLQRHPGLHVSMRHSLEICQQCSTRPLFFEFFLRFWPIYGGPFNPNFTKVKFQRFMTIRNALSLLSRPPAVATPPQAGLPIPSIISSLQLPLRLVCFPTPTPFLIVLSRSIGRPHLYRWPKLDAQPQMLKITNKPATSPQLNKEPKTRCLTCLRLLVCFFFPRI